MRLLVRRYCANDPPGTRIGMTWRVFDKKKLIAVGQRSAVLRRDCTIVTWLRLPRPVARGKRYTATFALNDRNGIFCIGESLFAGQRKPQEEGTRKSRVTRRLRGDVSASVSNRLPV